MPDKNLQSIQEQLLDWNLKLGARMLGIADTGDTDRLLQEGYNSNATPLMKFEPGNDHIFSPNLGHSQLSRDNNSEMNYKPQGDSGRHRQPQGHRSALQQVASY